MKLPYEKTLKYSGFKTLLSLVQDNPIGKTTRKLRKKKGNLLQSPFSNWIKTNIGIEFLKLVSRHFPKSGFYGTILNRNTIKIYYSCSLTWKRNVQPYHKTLQNSNKTADEDSKPCNCKYNCPFNGERLTKGVIYKATAIQLLDINVKILLFSL